MRTIDEDVEQRVRSRANPASRKFPYTVTYSWANVAKKRGRIVAFIGGIVLVMGVLALVKAGYTAPWTGFSAQQSLPVKTLWDWLQLLTIPAVLAIGGLLFYRRRERNDREDIRDSQRDALLQAYFDRMSELLLVQDGESEPTTSSLAKARTGATLRLLDTTRRGILIRFLCESNAIEKALAYDLEGVDLTGADLSQLKLRLVNFSKAKLAWSNFSEADLRNAQLSQADLGEATLRGANLSGVDLRNVLLDGADLRRANLSGADLTGATLDGADLRGAHLDGAILDSATLLKALVTPEQVDEAKSAIGVIV